MLLEKDGITYEVVYPTEIARLKRAGYKEVKAEEPVTEPAPKMQPGRKEIKAEKPVKEGEG